MLIRNGLYYKTGRNWYKEARHGGRKFCGIVAGMGGLTQASAMPPWFEFGRPESAEGFSARGESAFGGEKARLGC